MSSILNTVRITVEATIQILYDVGLFDRFDNRDEFFKEHLTFRKRRRGDWKKTNDNIQRNYFNFIIIRRPIAKVELEAILKKEE